MDSVVQALVEWGGSPTGFMMPSHVAVGIHRVQCMCFISFDSKQACFGLPSTRDLCCDGDRDGNLRRGRSKPLGPTCAACRLQLSIISTAQNYVCPAGVPAHVARASVTGPAGVYLHEDLQIRGLLATGNEYVQF